MYYFHVQWKVYTVCLCICEYLDTVPHVGTTGASHFMAETPKPGFSLIRFGIVAYVNTVVICSCCLCFCCIVLWLQHGCYYQPSHWLEKLVFLPSSSSFAIGVTNGHAVTYAPQATKVPFEVHLTHNQLNDWLGRFFLNDL